MSSRFPVSDGFRPAPVSSHSGEQRSISDSGMMYSLLGLPVPLVHLLTEALDAPVCSAMRAGCEGILEQQGVLGHGENAGLVVDGLVMLSPSVRSAKPCPFRRLTVGNQSSISCG